MTNPTSPAAPRMTSALRSYDQRVFVGPGKDFDHTMTVHEVENVVIFESVDGRKYRLAEIHVNHADPADVTIVILNQRVKGGDFARRVGSILSLSDVQAFEHYAALRPLVVAALAQIRRGDDQVEPTVDALRVEREAAHDVRDDLDARCDAARERVQIAIRERDHEDTIAGLRHDLRDLIAQRDEATRAYRRARVRELDAREAVRTAEFETLRDRDDQPAPAADECALHGADCETRKALDAEPDADQVSTLDEMIDALGTATRRALGEVALRAERRAAAMAATIAFVGADLEARAANAKRAYEHAVAVFEGQAWSQLPGSERRNIRALRARRDESAAAFHSFSVIVVANLDGVV